MYDTNWCYEDDESVVGSEEEQTHVHEFGESVKLAEEDEDRHNHRTAGVTGEVIKVEGGRHVHKVYTKTDFLDHYHEICVTTGVNLPIHGTHKHVHVIAGCTSLNDNHCHAFVFTTQIEAPLV